MREVDLKQNNLAACLVVMGAIRPPREQKLLPVPRIERRSSLDFDPNLEANYLARLPVEMRRGQLKREVESSLAELYLSEVGHTYEMVDSRLVDRETKQDIEELTRLGKNPEEVIAIQKLNELLNNGKPGLVVNISQENEDLGYPDNMVDIWKMHNDGTVKVLRCKVVGNEQTFQGFYRSIGGEKIAPNKSEILSDPVKVENLRLAEILNLLAIEKCEAKYGVEDIGSIAEGLLVSFEKRFKDKLTRDPNTILRFYLAVKEEIKKLGNKTFGNIADKKAAVEKIINNTPKEKYLSAPLSVTRGKGGGCGAESLNGAFAKEGWVLVMKDGKLSSYFGSTEGLTYCSQCGCWHEGSKCPYCDKA